MTPPSQAPSALRADADPPPAGRAPDPAGAPSPGGAWSAEDVLERLAARVTLERPVALVVAHPDDESIGVGGAMARFLDLTLLQLTDGAPLDLKRAQAAGFKTRRDYAQARRGELIDALAVATSGLSRWVCYEIPDACLADHLDVLIDRLAADLISVEAVLTHPYEGGHIDHDAAAFAVQAACARLARNGGHAPVRLEFTSYHRHHGLLRSGRFWDDPDCPEIAVPLSPDAAWRKEAAFACHRSQADNLRAFGFGPERFRKAPVYDFSRPPPPVHALYGPEESARLAAAIAAL